MICQIFKKNTIQLLHYPIQKVQLEIHRVKQMILEKRKKIVIRASQLFIKNITYIMDIKQMSTIHR